MTRKEKLTEKIKLYLEFIRETGGPAKTPFTEWVDKELRKLK